MPSPAKIASVTNASVTNASVRTAAQSAVDAAAEIAALRAELKRLQPIAALGDLTGTATHEFNNVLMTIMNYAKLGLRNTDTPSRDKALTKILEASQRAAKITSTILAQARNRSDVPEPTDMKQIVHDSLTLLEKELRKYRVAVELDLHDDVPAAVVSGNDIQRVLLNLLINARQAMPHGGTVLIRLVAADGGRSIELTVRDSGQGIAADVLPKIFEPYFSTKTGPDDSGKGGTGLGLAACKEIIDNHHGRIRVESSLGRGTAFILRLPTTLSSQAAA